MGGDGPEWLPADARGVARAAALLRAGRLVAVPTETVYGLAARADSEEAVAAIFRAKGRPDFNPLIVHVASLAMARSLAEFDDRAERLAASFWPGPLTLVLPSRRASPIVPAVTAGLPTVALRMPDHPAMREWLTTLWEKGKALIVDGVADPDSDLRRGIESVTVRAGEVLRDDPAVAAKVDEALQRMTGHVVTHYAEDLAGVISTTVERWDTAETSRRLELQVGRDLQFIRINGTVVGALAGLAIYAIAQLF